MDLKKVIVLKKVDSRRDYLLQTDLGSPPYRNSPR
jgi:hypothetical protein